MDRVDRCYRIGWGRVQKSKKHVCVSDPSEYLESVPSLNCVRLSKPSKNFDWGMSEQSNMMMLGSNGLDVVGHNLQNLEPVVYLNCMPT
jgi:hypothetical protein